MNEKKTYLNKINIFVSFLLILFIFEIFLVIKKINIHSYFCKKPLDLENKIQTEEIVQVDLYRVTTKSNKIVYDTYGTIIGEYECPIMFEVGGNIKYISPNKYVKKDEIIISLDTTTENAKLNSLQTLLHIKQSKLARTQKLVKNNILSINEEEQVISEISELESRIIEIEQKIKNMTIYAVTDGYFFLNNTANKINGQIPSRQQIGYFFSHKKFIKFYLPHEFTKYLNHNEKLNILFFPDFDISKEALKGQLNLSTNYDNIRPLTLQENEHKNSLCECLGELEDNNNENNNLPIQYFYNRTGKIHLTFNQEESYILIPEIAVYTRGVKNYVYVIQDNIALLTEIEIISTDESGMFKIKSNNINNNTVIVLRGLNKIHHMSKIKGVI